jgi:hypothetical protein
MILAVAYILAHIGFNQLEVLLPAILLVKIGGYSLFHLFILKQATPNNRYSAFRLGTYRTALGILVFGTFVVLTSSVNFDRLYQLVVPSILVTWVIDIAMHFVGWLLLFYLFFKAPRKLRLYVYATLYSTIVDIPIYLLFVITGNVLRF